MCSYHEQLLLFSIRDEVDLADNISLLSPAAAPEVGAMRIHDITMDVEPGMLYWRDGKPPEVIAVHRMADGAESEVSRWLIGAHTGTHIDAPRHFIPTGLTVDQLPLETFVGPARVVDLTSQGDLPITAETVRGAKLNGATRVLFKTSNSEKRLSKREFSPHWVGVTSDGAEALVDQGVRLAGIDYVTIESADQTEKWPTHHILCGAGVVILEGAKLRDIADGTYFMCCLPMRLKGSEAAATRTILIEGLPLGA
jgi:arylformamidase